MNVAALLHPEPANPRLFAPPAPLPLSAPVTKAAYRPARPRSPSPPSVGARVHLGTFLDPHTPFPYPLRSPTTANGSAITASVVVAGASAEQSLAARADPPLWGGAPSHPARTYTDDSDVLLAAIHAGKLAPARPPNARAALVDLRLWPDTARYPPTPSPALDGLASKGWFTVHDGGAFEVLAARWTSEAPDALVPSTRTRKHRMREYADRRRVVLAAEQRAIVFTPSGRVSYKYDAAAVRHALFPAQDVPAAKRRRTSAAASSHEWTSSDIVLRTAPTSATGGVALVVFRLEDPAPPSAADDPLVNATNKDVVPPPKLNGHVNGTKAKRKRPAAVPASTTRYTVFLRRASASASPPFREAPRTHEEQERMYGAPLRGPPAPAAPVAAGGGEGTEKALLRGARELDVELLPRGVALWAPDGTLCFLPVRAWSP